MNIQKTVTKLLPFTHITTPKISSNNAILKFLAEGNTVVFSGHSLYDNPDIGQGDKFLVTGGGGYNGKTLTIVSKNLDEDFNTLVKIQQTIPADELSPAIADIIYNELVDGIKDSIQTFTQSAMVTLEGAFKKGEELFQIQSYNSIEKTIIAYVVAALIIQTKSAENMEGVGSGSGVGSANGYGQNSATPAGQILSKAKSGDSEVEFTNLTQYTSSGGGSGTGGGSGFTAYLTDSANAMIRRYMRLANDICIEHYKYPIDTFADNMDGIDGQMWMPFLEQSPTVLLPARETDFPNG